MSNKLELKAIVLTFTDGTVTFIDPTKVKLVDIQTNKPLFTQKKPRKV